MELTNYTYESLRMVPIQTGSMANNCYIVADTERKECVVIDASFDFQQVLRKIEEEGWRWTALWLTHAHFDHIYGAKLTETEGRDVPIALHPDDEAIRTGGGSARVGQARGGNCPAPRIPIADGTRLTVGKYGFTVLHTPGHSPGSVCYYCAAAGWLFSGDTVFYHDHGRIDLFGGSQRQIEASINTRVLTLPDETLIFPGHEAFTSVGAERPFFGQYF